MATDFFYQANGTTLGPITGTDLKTLAASGAIERATLIKQGGNGPWVAAEHANGLFPPLATPIIKVAPPKPQAPAPMPVVITGVSISITDMANFMVKWAIATIPASLVIGLLGSIPWSLINMVRYPGEGYGLALAASLGVIAIWGAVKIWEKVG